MPASDREIIVVGYVKSGNTWVSRLLGEVLNSPVTGWGVALPLAKEGEGRNGHYIVRQLHLNPNYNAAKFPEFICSEWGACIPRWNGEKIVHVIRDPRDICVSAYYYWNRDTIQETIWAMIKGIEPFGGVGGYLDYVHNWLKVTEIPIY